VLAFASSTVFRIFFKVTFGTVIFGSLHGLLFLPVLLGTYMRISGIHQEDADDEMRKVMPDDEKEGSDKESRNMA
jgi:hypothetical protein